MFNYDETMLAANLSGGEVIVALDQRVFMKKHKKPHHFTLGAALNTATGPQALMSRIS
jgi:hypothetical protein